MSGSSDISVCVGFATLVIIVGNLVFLSEGEADIWMDFNGLLWKPELLICTLRVYNNVKGLTLPSLTF